MEGCCMKKMIFLLGLLMLPSAYMISSDADSDSSDDGLPVGTCIQFVGNNEARIIRPLSVLAAQLERQHREFLQQLYRDYSQSYERLGALGLAHTRFEAERDRLQRLAIARMQAINNNEKICNERGK